MVIVISACFLLIALTTVLHYEVLRALNVQLVALRVPDRSKLLVVILSMFVVHILEIVLYGVSIFILVRYFQVGSLNSPSGFSLTNCLYFSAETYTSLGFGDITPAGPLRYVAGIECLNGLLMIGWSASYLYIAMERFWHIGIHFRRRS